MARRQRQFSHTESTTFATGAATGDVKLDLYAPTEGAFIVDAVFTVNTAVGAHTNGTLAVVLEEIGTTRALTNSTGALTAETAANSVVGTAEGNEVSATAAGTRLQAQVTAASTVTTSGNWGVTVTWLT